MSRSARPRQARPAGPKRSVAEIRKPLSPQAGEELWEIVFALHLAQAIEDQLKAEKEAPPSARAAARALPDDSLPA